jgi:hypothetical protein
VSEYYLSGDINDLLNVELTCNDQVFFEILKMKIRSISISHSITKTREEKDLTLKLEKDILNLEDILLGSFDARYTFYHLENRFSMDLVIQRFLT